MSFIAKAGTTGNSRALRLDAALVKAHPEFAKGAFTVHVIGRGTMLVTQNASPETDLREEADPLLGAFLAFIEAELASHPERVRPVTGDHVRGLARLLDGVQVQRDEDLGDYRLP